MVRNGKFLILAENGGHLLKLTYLRRLYGESADSIVLTVVLERCSLGPIDSWTADSGGCGDNGEWVMELKVREMADGKKGPSLPESA